MATILTGITAADGGIQPITSSSDAITAQQQALASTTPKSYSESIALNSQKKLLEGFQTIDQQQTTVETAYLVQNPQLPLYPKISVADQSVQIQALATDENLTRLKAAIRYGVDMWRLQAHFCNIQIMGQSAIGTPGCLDGPELKPWILQAQGIIGATGVWATLSQAVADAVDTNFRQWQDSVTVPGLPWYPSFVAIAAPFAPPTPNIPMPLVVCVAQHFSKLSSVYQLETQIIARLPSEFLITEMNNFIHQLSMQLAAYFTTWMGSQQVMMVMGMGPVPTFNPPYVPVGRVINGYIIPSPGHLAV